MFSFKEIPMTMIHNINRLKFVKKYYKDDIFGTIFSKKDGFEFMNHTIFEMLKEILILVL